MADFSKTVRALAKSGSLLTVRQLAVLLQVYEHRTDAEARQVKRLALALDLNKPAITRAGDALEDEGLLLRAPQMDDKRGCVFSLSAAGKRYVEKSLGVAA